MYIKSTILNEPITNCTVLEAVGGKGEINGTVGDLSSIHYWGICVEACLEFL